MSSLPVREDPPKSKTRTGAWMERLTLLVADPNNWYRVYEAGTTNYAGTAVSQLRKREYNIPEPEHEWEFTARGNMVYARYTGKARKGK